MANQLLTLNFFGRGEGGVRAAADGAVRVRRGVDVAAVRAGEHAAGGAADGVRVPDVGGGRGGRPAGRAGGDRRLRARVRRRARHRRHLLRLAPRHARRRKALLPAVLPGMPQHRRPLLQPRRRRRCSKCINILPWSFCHSFCSSCPEMSFKYNKTNWKERSTFCNFGSFVFLLLFSLFQEMSWFSFTKENYSPLWLFFLCCESYSLFSLDTHPLLLAKHHGWTAQMRWFWARSHVRDAEFTKIDHKCNRPWSNFTSQNPTGAIALGQRKTTTFHTIQTSLPCIS